MNSKDLTFSAINGIPEKIPFNPFIMHLAASLIGVDYTNDYCRNPETLVKAQNKIANTFGIDHVNVSTDAYREASAWGVEIDWTSNTPVAKTYLDWEEFDSIEKPDLLTSERIQSRISSVKKLKEICGEKQCVVGWIYISEIYDSFWSSDGESILFTHKYFDLYLFDIEAYFGVPYEELSCEGG